MEREVTFLSRQWIEIHQEPTYVISVRCPGQKVSFAVEHKSVLALSFDDIEEHLGDEYVLFDYQHGDRILSWLDKVPSDQNVIVHCEAGISRSAAIAKFMGNNGWNLNLSYPGCYGKLDSYNGHVFGLLRMMSLDRKGKN